MLILNAKTMAFCKHCGNKLKEKAKYCGECGRSIKAKDIGAKPNEIGTITGSQSQKKTTGKLLLNIKPKFILLVRTASLFIPFILLAGFITVFVWMGKAGSSTIPFKVYIILGFIGFTWLGVPLAQVYFQHRTYQETEYKIYDDRVEYSEGFFSVQNNRIRLNRVVDVSYKQSIPQRWYDLGTITLYVAGTNNKITFRDISEPQKIYMRIDELIGHNS